MSTSTGLLFLCFFVPLSGILYLKRHKFKSPSVGSFRGIFLFLFIVWHRMASHTCFESQEAGGMGQTCSRCVATHSCSASGWTLAVNLLLREQPRCATILLQLPRTLSGFGFCDSQPSADVTTGAGGREGRGGVVRKHGRVSVSPFSCGEGTIYRAMCLLDAGQVQV